MQQPLEIMDFSGGRTDNYVEGPLNCFQKADNCVIVRQSSVGKLLSRFGSTLYSSSFPLVNPAIARIGTIRNFRTTSGDKLLVHSDKKIYTLQGGGWTALTGPSGNQIFTAATTVSNVVSYAEWNDHIFVTNDAFDPVSKLYNDGSNVLKLRTAGLPSLASAPTVTPVASTGKSYLYRFFYQYTYTVGTVTFIDAGNITEVAVTNADAPNVNANNIAVIPVISNGATYNWDTANIKVEIYRTANAGTSFFFVGEVTNGTTTFSDTVSDATLLTRQAIYTAGGVVQNDPTPLAKLVHITGDIAYYANIKSGTQLLSNRLLQAVPGDPDSVPGSFFVDVQDAIIGLSSTRGFPILLCKNSVYRIDGTFDLLGRGGMTATKISDTATCVSSQSVVQTIEGVFWAGEDSYYFSDGYQVIKLVLDWTDTYKSRVLTSAQKNRIQGKYDKRTRRIWWTIQSDSGGSSECNVCDILHLDWGIKPDACFTSASGGAEFAPTAIEFLDGDMFRGDKNGYLLIHQDALTTDPKIDISISPSTWDTNAIIWDYLSTAYNFGTSFMRKYATKVIVSCLNKSNLSLQIVSINDDGKKIENLKPIRFRGNLVWEDPLVVWGDPSLVWGFDGLIEELRRIPSNSLRFAYKQIRLTNANVIIVNSDSLGDVTVNNSAKTAVLDANVWPTNLANYTISFSSDNYTKAYPISARTSTTLTYLDSLNTSSSGTGIQWEIRGQPKQEIFSLLSYSIAYQIMGQTQQFFTPAESGAVSS